MPYLSNSALNISKVRGKVFDFKGIGPSPSFHPGYLLRHPSAKKEVYIDMLLAQTQGCQ
ncbi:MAG: hypothetical protein U9Q62_08845 [Campylobacterota bacterium]|nr:hypothetical protein [Campylobacterota bacterium]